MKYESLMHTSGENILDVSQSSCLQQLLEDSRLTCGSSCIIYRQRGILSF